MYLRTIEIAGIDTLGRKRSKFKFELQCDHCGVVFSKINKKLYLTRLNFCGVKCKNLSSKLQQKINQTCKERYEGRGNASSALKQKSVQTCVEKYDVDHPWKDVVVRQRGLNTMERLYGSRGSFGNEDLREKTKETLLQRYGVDHPMRDTDVIKLRQDRCLKLNNVEHPSMLHSVQDKMKETWMKTLGVDSPMKSPIVRAKIDYVENNRKRIETLKKEGRLFFSKPENRLGEWLTKEFSNIKRQSWINRSSVDFYVVDIDVYIQLDGVYWHGLMGEQHVTPNIQKTIKRDQTLNDWFRTNNKKLFRVTDLQLNKSLDCVENALLLKNELMSCQNGVTFFSGTPSYNHVNEHPIKEHI